MAQNAGFCAAIIVQLPFTSTDERDALWFQNRDWRDLIEVEWDEYFRGLFFFTNEAIAYYLPSVILLSTKPLNQRMLATDSMLMRLVEEGIICSVNDSGPTDRLQLTVKECAVLSGWLQHLCSLPSYEVGTNRIRIERCQSFLAQISSSEDSEMNSL